MLMEASGGGLCTHASFSRGPQKPRSWGLTGLMVHGDEQVIRGWSGRRPAVAASPVPSTRPACSPGWAGGTGWAAVEREVLGLPGSSGPELSPLGAGGEDLLACLWHGHPARGMGQVAFRGTPVHTRPFRCPVPCRKLGWSVTGPAPRYFLSRVRPFVSPLGDTPSAHSCRKVRFPDRKVTRAHRRPSGRGTGAQHRGRRGFY